MNPTRVALLIPHTDTTLETDLKRELPQYYVLHTQRIPLGEVGLEAEKKMVSVDLPAALDYMEGITDFDFAVFGCTSASAVYGSDGVGRLEEMISEKLGCIAKSALGAVLDQLESIGNRNISLVTPYDDEVNGFMMGVLKEFGFTVDYSCGMGLRNDIEIARIQPTEIVDFVKHNASCIGSVEGTVLVSCTNLRATEIREKLEGILGRPVVTSNQSIINWLKKEGGQIKRY